MTQSKPTPVEYLKRISEATGTAFQDLRRSVLAAGPLDADVCELIALGGLVTCGSESGFKTHARRLLKDQVSPEALRQAVLVTFGASTTFSQVIDGLRWVDDVAAEAAP